MKTDFLSLGPVSRESCPFSPPHGRVVAVPSKWAALDESRKPEVENTGIAAELPCGATRKLALPGNNHIAGVLTSRYATAGPSYSSNRRSPSELGDALAAFAEVA